MKPEHSLHLRMGACGVELVTEHAELWLSLGHIYRAFTTNSVPSLPSGLDELGEGDWRASIGERDFHFTDFPTAIEELEDVIANQLLLKSRNALLLHAAVVCNERHILFLIGPSGSGKTTLSLEFTRRGMRYVTDEFAIISKDMLQPFPRSATQKYEGPLPAGQNLVIPDDSGHRSHLLPHHRTGVKPLRMPARRIIFPTFGPDKIPSVRRISTAEASAKLMCSTFDINDRVEQVWPALVDFVKGASVCTFNYRDAEADLDIVLKFFDTEK